MSKLSRYKKGPVIKLPRVLSKKLQPTIEDEDDDFQIPRIKESSVDRKIPKNSSSQKFSVVSSSKFSITGDSSQSEYFPENNNKSKHEKVGSSNIINEKKVEVNNGITEEAATQHEQVEVDLPSENKVVCPFCWKRLNDKLTGTTHVKSCAKNLPTNQIFEALQLQEKQIKEWERLGIAYPGFVGGSTTTGNGAAAGKKTANKIPRTRKKKQDPELELAIALSESLHEEVERRKTQENEFNILNGIEQKTDTLSKVKEDNIKELLVSSKTSKPVVELMVNNRNKKRGEKRNVLELPLYKSTALDKAQEIEKRLNNILDENDNQPFSKLNEPFVREAISLNSLKVPSRLEIYKTKDASLWSLSNAENSKGDPKNAFETKALSDSKIRTPQDLRTNDEHKIQPSSIRDMDERLLYQKSENKSIVTKNVLNADRDKQCLSDGSEPPCKPIKNIPESFKNSASAIRLPTDRKPSLPKVIQDIMLMFAKKEDVDLVVYGREEKRIKCHKLIVKARCRKLFNEIVVEKSRSGRKREVIPLTCFSHVAVKAFVKFIYCGRLGAPILDQDLKDLNELCLKYDLPMIETPYVRDVQIQTDCISIEAGPSSGKAITRVSMDLFCDESSTQQNNHKLGNNHSQHQKDKDVYQSDDFFQVTHVDSIEKEKTIRERSAENTHERVLNMNKRSVNMETTIEMDIIRQNRERNRSRDLFEDDENEVQDVDLISNGFCCFGKKDPLLRSPAQVSNNGILEDELLSPESKSLLLPKPYNKRSRSLSPVVDNFHDISAAQQLTATQMAEYLDHLGLGRKLQDSFEDHHHQANKKHKLDLDSSSYIDNDENGNNDSVELLENGFLLETLDVTAKLKNAKCDIITNSSIGLETPDISLKIQELKKDAAVTTSRTSVSNPFKSSDVSVSKNPNYIPIQSSPLQETCNSSFSNYMKNINDPESPILLSSPKLNLILTQQKIDAFPLASLQNEDPDDPFAKDDSCFVNLPSQLLNIPEELFSSTDNSCFLNLPLEIPEPSVYPQSSTDNVRSSDNRQEINKPKTSILLKGDDGNVLKDKISYDQQTTNKGKKVTKTVRGRTKSCSQRNPVVTVTQHPSTPTRSTLNSSSQKTPGLNYSLLDTPLLKKELKRYGLKPLPRSKAKVILRHIDKETH